jgi:CPA1 family monovalent cation:H+ antiporter
MSERTHAVVDNFWNMAAFLANALLFLLIGAEFHPQRFLASHDLNALFLTAALAIVAVLLARFIMVLLLPRKPSTAGAVPLRSWRFVIFWSGLRGALSLALVLALPLDIPARDTLIAATYAVILFTLLVQGISLRFILRHLPAVARK